MKIHFFKSEYEWLQHKRGKASASEISKLLPNGTGKQPLGVGGKSYVKKLFAQTVADPILDPYVSVDMQHGKDEEPEAVEELGKLFPFDTVEHYGGNLFTFCEHNDFSGCSPDVLISNSEKVYIKGAEIKCPTSREIHLTRLIEVFDNETLKKHDADIYAQIQFNMTCFGLKEWLFASYYRFMHDPKTRLHVVAITPDPEMQELIQVKLKAAEEYFGELKERYEYIKTKLAN